MASDTQNHIDLRLTPDEALVLFEFLSRYSNSDELLIKDQAERRALWNLCCLIEQQLVEPLKPNYMELLETARNRLRDDEDPNGKPGASRNGGPATPLDNSGATEGPPSVS